MYSRSASKHSGPFGRQSEHPGVQLTCLLLLASILLVQRLVNGFDDDCAFLSELSEHRDVHLPAPFLATPTPLANILLSRALTVSLPSFLSPLSLAWPYHTSLPLYVLFSLLKSPSPSSSTPLCLTTKLYTQGLLRPRLLDLGRPVIDVF